MLLLLAVLPVTGLSPSPVLACASCACGDPTLTLFGQEKPFENRFRASLEYRRRSESTGAMQAGRIRSTEDRFTLGAAWAPVESLMAGIQVPLVRKEMTEPNLAEQGAFGLGDIELTAKLFFWPGSDAGYRRHLFGILAGLRFPTSRTEQDGTGAPLAIEAQPGTGAWAGNIGGWYGYYRNPWSMHLTVYAHLPSEGRLQYEAGKAFLASGTLQYQIVRQVAVQAGLDTRWSRRDREGGVIQPNSGGAILFVSPGVIWSPIEDFLVHVIARIPAANGLNGSHQEGVYIQGGMIYDFSTTKTP